MTRYARSALDITVDIGDWALAGLSQKDAAVVLKLLARVAERSYRRGFQQGATIQKNRPQDLPKDLHDWRYGPTTDLSPWADGPVKEPSRHLLVRENHGLARMNVNFTAVPVPKP